MSDRLLRQRNGLMIYNKIELVLITKIFSYYKNFSLEITPKVQKVNQKYTFTHKLTTKCNFQTVTEWNALGCGISKAAEDSSTLPSKIDQMKVSHETRSDANFGFGRTLMHSYLRMCPPKGVFFRFWMQSWATSGFLESCPGVPMPCSVYLQL